MAEEASAKDEQLANGQVQVAGDEHGEGQTEEQSLPAVTLMIPTPTCSLTVPTPARSITLYPSPSETIQDLKLLINDWIGAYWLGPYSLRLPGNELYSTKKDGGEIRGGEKLNEWMEVGDVFEHEPEQRVLEVVREPYGDFTARQSIIRLLDLIAPSGTTASIALQTPLGLLPGSTIFESVRDGIVSSKSETAQQEVEVSLPSGKKGKGGKKEMVKVKKAVEGERAHAFADFKSWPAVSLGSLPVSTPLVQAPSCLKNIQLSPFNPPPPHLRAKGHQLYLLVSLVEGDVLTLVCCTRGWYVSKSNVNNFDPAPRNNEAPYHSLIDLLHSLSPRFSQSLSHLPPASQPPADPIASVPIPQAHPAYPFLSPSPDAPSPSQLRTQLALLHTGAYGPEGVEGARDWNEEIQGVRELPRNTVEERVGREKMMDKVFSEFEAAAVRAVQAVQRGDLPPLNPSEPSSAHMFLINNIFITPASPSSLPPPTNSAFPDPLAHLGGPAVVGASHGKDAKGVKLLNKLDVPGLSMLGHCVVEWGGSRWVGQSILPGIFSSRAGAAGEDKAVESEKKEDWVDVEHSPKKTTASAQQVADVDASPEAPAANPMMIYGQDSESPSLVHWDSATHKLFSHLAKPLHLAPHSVEEGKEFHASVEVKGLKGLDGRTYVLDAQRLLPVDVEWLEKDTASAVVNGATDEVKYPHRLVLLRPELVEGYWEGELREWVKVQSEKNQAKKAEADQAENKEADTESKPTDDTEAKNGEVKPEEKPEDNVDPAFITDIKDFKLSFNTDAFVESPVNPSDPSSADVEIKVKDESDPAVAAVRAASKHLREKVIPNFVEEVMASEVNGGTLAMGLMDGESLVGLMHGRGINVRYLGHLAKAVEERKEEGGLKTVLLNLVNQEMIFRSSKHILRALLYPLHPDLAPQAISHFLNCLLGSSLNAHPKAEWTPLGLDASEVQPEYVALTPEELKEKIKVEVRSRFRWELHGHYLEGGLRKKQILRELALRVGFQLFQRDYYFSSEDASTVSAASTTVAQEKGDKKLKGKKEEKKEKKREMTFESEDVLTLVPIVKSTAPSSTIAEEILEAARSTISRSQFDLGLSFMLESVQLYETIHSVIHPSVAASYNTYAQTVHQVARIKIHQMSQGQRPEGQGEPDPEEPLGVDVATALKLQRQAVVVAERTLGMWHHQTAQYYFNLAMLENLEGNAGFALRFFRHVIRIWDVIYGEGHPEVVTLLNNVGIILQTINDPLALEIQTLAHEHTVALYGPEHLLAGRSHDHLVQVYFISGSHALALEHARTALDIYRTHLGEEDSQTKDSMKNVELLEAVIERDSRVKQEEVLRKEVEAKARIAGQGRRGAPGQPPLQIDAQTLAALTQAAQAPNPGAGGEMPTQEQIKVARELANSLAAAQIVAPSGTPTNSSEPAVSGPNGEALGTQNIDDLVRYIQGTQAAQGALGDGGALGGIRRGKNALRGKRRTGSKR